MTPTTHPAVTEYLRAVDRALADVPRARREEIVADLREHVDAALAERPDAGDAYVRTLLDRLGSPADIAAEAAERFGAAPARPRRRWLEGVSLLLITAGSLLLPVVGWSAGILGVWSSRVWRTKEKVLATLLFPFGLFPGFYLLIAAGYEPRSCWTDPNGVTSCTGTDPSIWLTVLAWVLMLASVVGTLVSAGVLARRLSRTAP